MNTEKYIVRLSEEERQKLEIIVKKLKGTSQKVKRAIALLKADADGPNWTNEKIRELTGLSIQAIVNIRKQLVLEGFEVVLDRKKRRLPPVPKKLDGLQEAQLIATRCGSPPEGFGQWSLRLLANQTVVLEIVDSVSHETVRKTLKKTV
jgi:biotin operon repressor